MAITALVLAIVALPSVCCYGVLAIPLGGAALVLGRMSLGRIRASGGALSGEGLAQAGWIMGLTAGSLGLLYILFIVGTIIFMGFVTPMLTPTPTPTP